MSATDSAKQRIRHRIRHFRCSIQYKINYESESSWLKRIRALTSQRRFHRLHGGIRRQFVNLGSQLSLTIFPHVLTLLESMGSFRSLQCSVSSLQLLFLVIFE